MSLTEPSLAADSPSATPPEQQEEETGSSSGPASPEASSASPPVSEPAGPGAALPEASPPPPPAAAPEPPAGPAAPAPQAAPRPAASRLGPETFRQRFRQFRYQDAAGPREAFRQLRELSRQWLRPDVRTKEQIVEMLVQEQLQAVLPPEARAWRARRRADARITG